MISEFYDAKIHTCDNLFILLRLSNVLDEKMFAQAETIVSHRATRLQTRAGTKSLKERLEKND